MASDSLNQDDDASSTTDFTPFKPGKGRHGTLTAVAVAEEQHERPVDTPETIEAADELRILDDYAESSIKRRLTTLYYQGFLNREGDRGSFEYSVSQDGRDELDEHGHYQVDR